MYIQQKKLTVKGKRFSFCPHGRHLEPSKNSKNCTSLIDILQKLPFTNYKRVMSLLQLCQYWLHSSIIVFMFTVIRISIKTEKELVLKDED